MNCSAGSLLQRDLRKPVSQFGMTVSIGQWSKIDLCWSIGSKKRLPRIRFYYKNSNNSNNFTRILRLNVFDFYYCFDGAGFARDRQSNRKL